MSRWLLKLAFFNWLKSRNCIKIGPKCILLLPITRDVVATPCPTLLLFHPGLEPAMAESKMHKLHKFWIFNRLMLMNPCCGRTFSINTSLRLNEPVWRISSTYWKHFVTPHSSSVSNTWTLYRNSSAVWQVLWKRKLTICRYKALNASQKNYHSCFTYNEITCFDNPPFCFSLYG